MAPRFRSRSFSTPVLSIEQEQVVHMFASGGGTKMHGIVTGVVTGVPQGYVVLSHATEAGAASIRRPDSRAVRQGPSRGTGYSRVPTVTLHVFTKRSHCHV